MARSKVFFFSLTRQRTYECWAYFFPLTRGSLIILLRTVHAKVFPLWRLCMQSPWPAWHQTPVLTLIHYATWRVAFVLGWVADMRRLLLTSCSSGRLYQSDNDLSYNKCLYIINSFHYRSFPARSHRSLPSLSRDGHGRANQIQWPRKTFCCNWWANAFQWRYKPWRETWRGTRSGSDSPSHCMRTSCLSASVHYVKDSLMIVSRLLVLIKIPCQ